MWLTAESAQWKEPSGLGRVVTAVREQFPSLKLALIVLVTRTQRRYGREAC